MNVFLSVPVLGAGFFAFVSISYLYFWAMEAWGVLYNNPPNCTVSRPNWAHPPLYTVYAAL